MQRKHRNGYEDLDYDHYYQRQKLKEFQKQDISIIPPDVISSIKKSSSSNTRKSKPIERIKRRHLSDEEEVDNNKKPKSMSPTARMPPPPPLISNRKSIPNVDTRPPFLANSRPNGPPIVASSSSNKPPIVASSGSIGPPIVASSASNKPPFISSSRSSEPPTIKVASKDQPKGKKRGINPSASSITSTELNHPDKSSMSNERKRLKEKNRPSKHSEALEKKQTNNNNQHKETRPSFIETSHNRPITIESISQEHLSTVTNASNNNVPSNRKSRWNSSSSDNNIQSSFSREIPLQTARRSRPLPPSKDSSRSNTNKSSSERFNKTFNSSNRPTITESPRKSRWNAPHSRESSPIVNSSRQSSPSHNSGRNRVEAASTVDKNLQRNVPRNGETLSSSEDSSQPNSPSQSISSNDAVATSTVESSQTISPTISLTKDASSKSSTIAAPTINMSRWDVPSNSSRKSSPVRSSIIKSTTKDIQSGSSSHTNSNCTIAAFTVDLSRMKSLNTQSSRESSPIMDSSSKDSQPNSPSKTQNITKPKKSRWNLPPTLVATGKTEPSSHGNSFTRLQEPTTATTTTTAAAEKIPTSRFRSNQPSKPNSASPLPGTTTTTDTETTRPLLRGNFRFQPPKLPSERRIPAPTFGNAPSHMIWSAPPEPAIGAHEIHELLGIDRPAPEPSTIVVADKIHELVGINRPAPPPGPVVIPPRPRSRPNRNNNNSRAIAPPTIQSSSSKQPPTIESSSYSPLFIDKRHKSKVFSLMDNGQIVIRSKPNRVVIKGKDGKSKAYGDPKDYDDAINGIDRATNPVYKRMMDRTQYLFFKQETGAVVTIGPVSKIQPLIHKFFLAR